MYKHAIAKFRGAVHVKPIQAYKDLIKEIKEASTSFVTDLSNADEGEVFASIHNLTGLYFLTDVAFKQRIARERESVECEYQHKWNEDVVDLVEYLHHNAAETAHYLHNTHIILAMIKPKVSDATLTDTDITLDPAPAASSTPCPGDEEAPAPPVQEKATGSPGRSSRPHVCTFCKKGFDKLPALNMHKAQKHKFKVELTSCPKCSKTFSSLASMQQHHESKHKLKEFHCDIDDCDYFSNTLEQLDHHRRRNHRSTFRFRCSKCHFVSVTSTELGQQRRCSF